MALCPAQAWAFSFEELLLCEMAAATFWAGIPAQYSISSSGVVGVSHVPCTGCGNRALLPGFGGASAEHLGRGSAGRKGWMEHSAHQCVKKNVKNLLQEDGPTQPII